jgi:serine protease Do
VEGVIVGADTATDLALVRIAGNGYPVAKLGNSDSLLIGEWSIAIGNPFGFLINDAHPSVTVGVISAVNRNFAPSEGTVYQNMIQTDAAINPGNSGGPLVNAAGEVIGINAFIFTSNKSNKGSIGIGFAIPINRAKRVVEELVTYGMRRPIWTGIYGDNLNRSVAMALGYDRTWGVVITGIAKNSPGDVAGLAAGDIIVRMDNTRIYSMADFEGLWADCYVGDVVDVHYVRKGKDLRTSMLLKAMPER